MVTGTVTLRTPWGTGKIPSILPETIRFFGSHYDVTVAFNDGTCILAGIFDLTKQGEEAAYKLAKHLVTYPGPTLPVLSFFHPHTTKATSDIKDVHIRQRNGDITKEVRAFVPEPQQKLNDSPSDAPSEFRFRGYGVSLCMNKDSSFENTCAVFPDSWDGREGAMKYASSIADDNTLPFTMVKSRRPIVCNVLRFHSILLYFIDGRRAKIVKRVRSNAAEDSTKVFMKGYGICLFRGTKLVTSAFYGDTRKQYKKAGEYMERHMKKTLRDKSTDDRKALHRLVMLKGNGVDARVVSHFIKRNGSWHSADVLPGPGDCGVTS